MDFIFGQTFEVFLIVVLAAFTVLLFTGNGGFLLRSKSNQKPRTAEQERYLSRHLGVVTLLWMLGEMMLAFFGSSGWVTIAYIVILVISLVYLARLFKQYD